MPGARESTVQIWGVRQHIGWGRFETGASAGVVIDRPLVPSIPAALVVVHVGIIARPTSHRRAARECGTRSHTREIIKGVTNTDQDADTETSTGWLSPEDLELVRAHVPIVYVDAVPVRVDSLGNVTEVGMLLRVASDGSISRMVVTGRVLFGERVREALMRHCEKDLGPMALPRVPANPTPFTVVEYFPNPDRSGFYDPRHHAVSLAYVVPVEGDCEPTQEALDLAWFTPEEAVSSEVVDQMTSGHDRLIRLALAHVGKLP